MTNHFNVFIPEMKMVDLLEEHYHLLFILSRFNIYLGVGEKSVEQVCQDSGISTNFFLLICKIYSSIDYRPTKEELERLDIHELVAYLSKSHEHYIRERIYRIGEELQVLCNRLPEKNGKVLLKFFTEYKDELQNHFSFEESTVFPYIHDIAIGVFKEGFSIERFEDNHSNIEEKLHDLKSILLKYIPADLKLDYSSLLFNLFQLEEDLNRHTAIEEQVLIPLVNYLEISKR